jgi:hypothetical protein
MYTAVVNPPIPAPIITADFLSSIPKFFFQIYKLCNKDCKKSFMFQSEWFF